MLTNSAAVSQSRDKLPFWENGTGKREAWQNGWHGYDNELMEMRGIFLAYGPGTMPSSPSLPGTRLGLSQLGILLSKWIVNENIHKKSFCQVIL